MKREEVKAVFPEATDEQLKSIMDLNGADVERAKGKVAALDAELKEKNEALNALSTEFETLKQSNATAAEYKVKFEALQKETAEKAKQAEAERVAKEKAERIAGRFATVVGDKKFSHDAIKESYLRKFTEALDNKDNEGKSDADILHELTKDDAAAFVGVTAVKLAGGTNKGIQSASKYSTREDIYKIKDAAVRQQEILAHPDLFPEITK